MNKVMTATLHDSVDRAIRNRGTQTMEKTTSVLSALVVAAMLTHGASGGTVTNATPSLMGGWSNVSTTNAHVIVAAQNAVDAQAKLAQEKLALAAIVDAQQQVVAGMNYKMTVSVDRAGTNVLAAAVVWAKLDGTYETTKWEWK